MSASVARIIAVAALCPQQAGRHPSPEDRCQDVFVRAYEAKGPEFDNLDSGAQWSYLLKAEQSANIDEARYHHSGRRAGLSVDLDDVPDLEQTERPSLERTVQGEQRLQAYLEHVQSFSVKVQNTVMLCLEGKEHEDVARQLGMTVRQVRAYLQQVKSTAPAECFDR